MKKEQLKSLMEESKITTKELAKKTGYTIATILSYRCGARNIVPRAELAIINAIKEINNKGE